MSQFKVMKIYGKHRAAKIAKELERIGYRPDDSFSEHSKEVHSPSVAGIATDECGGFGFFFIDSPFDKGEVPSEEVMFSQLETMKEIKRKIEKTGWVNIYKSNICQTYIGTKLPFISQEEALAHVEHNDNYQDTVKITWTETEE